MLRYVNILARVAGTPWAIEETRGRAIMEFLAFKAAGGRLDPDEIAARIGRQARSDEGGIQGGIRSEHAAVAGPGEATIAVIPVHGIISPRMHDVDDISGPGAVSAEGLARRFRAAVEARDVDGIVLDVDSPGGNVFGIEELSNEIRAARVVKPVTAVANPAMHSAAYWIGSAAERLLVTPSGELGSIGVYSYHEDLSGMLEANGVRPTLIKAGANKAEGHPAFPLDDAAAAHMQERVDAYYRTFTAGVAEGRGRTVPDVIQNFGDGRSFGAEDAVARGMADAVGGLDQALAEMAETIAGGPPAAPAARGGKVVGIAQRRRRLALG